jgi:uncharacterized protein (DUF1501 family)
MLPRRQVLGTLAGAAIITRVGIAHAATDKRFVFVILRGGLDGLASVPPFFDPDYARLRSQVGPASPATGQNAAFDLDGNFGLHPALKSLHAMWSEGELAIVHAVASAYRERSHFDAQDLLENGTARARGAADGWLNRTVALLGGSDRRLGLSVGNATPLVLRGSTPVGSFAPQAMPDLNGDFLALLEQAYRGDVKFAGAFAEGMKAHAMNESVLGDERKGRNGGGLGAIRGIGESVGKLLAAANGPRIAAYDIGGWDTHAAQNVRLTNILRAFDESMDSLKRGLGNAWRHSVVVVATEFGRTAAANGTGGTDHGTASVAFVLGGAVRGKQLVARWPGLAAQQLWQGRDLAPTTDLRAVFKAALVAHLALPREAIDRNVFPESREIRELPDLIRS